MRFRPLLPAAIACLLALPSNHAIAQADATARFHEVDQLNSLDADGMRPWHLIATYTRFDNSGNTAATGTAEEWWVGKDQYRIAMTEGAVTQTKLVLPNDEHFFSSQQVDPDLMGLLAYVTHPVEDHGLDGAVERAYPRTFGKTKAECLMVEPAQDFKPPLVDRQFREPPLGLFPTYCVDDSNLLLASHPTADLVYASEKAGSFLGHRVAIGAVVLRGNKKLYQISVTHLSTLDPKDMNTATTDLLSARGTPALVASGVMAGRILEKGQPIYPEGAKRRHVSGTVLLRALIGTDGRIHGLRVVGSPDYDLLVSAVDAVSRWRYQPYLLNGEATEVDTTITVNFNLTSY